MKHYCAMLVRGKSTAIVNNAKKLPMKRYLPIIYQLIVVIVIIVAYHNTLNSPFVLDDVRNIVQNQYIQIDRFNIGSLKKVFSGLQPINTRPVAYLSFSLNYLLDGLNPRGYHIVNILIHIANALILLRLVKWYVRHEEGPQDNALLFSFAVALIWAVNPIQTSSVTYIVQRMTSLCTFFFMMSLLSYLTARDLFIGHEEGKFHAKSALFFFLTFLFWVLAMLTKEFAAILPVIIILHELFFYDGLSWKRTVQKIKIYLFALLVPAILTSMYLDLISLWNSIMQTYSKRDFSFAERLLTQPRAVVRYITLFLWPLPSRLTLYYDYQVSRSLFHPISTIFSISGILILIGGSCAFARKYKLICFGFLWTILCLVVESSFIPLELIFEHRFYLPSIGFSLAIVALSFRFFSVFVRNRNIIYALLIIVAFLLTWGTYKRNLDYKTELSLSLDAVEKAPRLIRSLNNLASAYIHAGDMASGKVVLERALELKPDDLLVLSNLFGLSVDMRKNQESEYYLHRLKQSLTNENYNCTINTSLLMVAEILFQRGRFAEAAFILEPLRVCNVSPVYYDNLAICYLQAGNYTQAIQDFKNALELDPQNLLLSYSLAEAYFLANEKEHAINELNKLKRLDLPVELMQKVKKMERQFDVK